MKNITYCDEIFIKNAVLAGEPGLEPRFMESKSIVLPLYYSPIMEESVRFELTEDFHPRQFSRLEP